MMDHHTTPRLWVNDRLQSGQTIELSEGPAHYVRHVMRLADGDMLRLFNADHGEWLGSITLTKKTVTVAVQENLKPAFTGSEPICHLYAPPLPKDRLDFLIEKAVELGVTDLTPLITDHTTIRTVNADRMHAQMIQAAEQCERLTVPTLHPILSLHDLLGRVTPAAPLGVAMERLEAGSMPPAATVRHFLVGPPGGFSTSERTLLQNHPGVVCLDLGPRILRTETAALVMLAQTLKVSHVS